MFEPSYPSFRNQPDDGAVLWRYMDLAKFMSMIQSKALHFARADMMDDPWEGAYGQANWDALDALARRNSGGRPYTIGMDPSHAKKRRQRVHLSCWHESPVESAAMWKIYEPNGKGIAARTTWGLLTRGVTDSRPVSGGAVAYIDHARTAIGAANEFNPFMAKRMAYAFEREVRLVMQTGHPDEAGNHVPEPPVIPVAVDLASVIEAVYVAPGSARWFADVVRQATVDAGLPLEVRRSEMESKPVG